MIIVCIFRVNEIVSSEKVYVVHDFKLIYRVEDAYTFSHLFCSVCVHSMVYFCSFY